MAAALAFRLFLWTLPATLVTVGLLGFTVDDDASEQPTGLGAYTLTTIEQPAAQAHRGRWLLVVIGGVLLLGVSYTLTKTVVVATALIWGRPLRTMRRPLRSIGVMLAAIAAGMGMAAVASFVRSVSPGFGLVATLAVAGLWALLWWLVSYLLPHADDLLWWGLLPGTEFLGVGTQLLHLVTVYYFAGRISSASDLYGSLGVAATLLLWAYVVSRLVLTSASINVGALRTYRQSD